MTSFEYDFFNENGYILIKNAVPGFNDPKLLISSQSEVESIVTKAKSGKLLSASSSCQYPKFIDGINISRIEHPWQECSPLVNIKKMLETIDFNDLFKRYLNLDYSSYFAYLFRMHVTSKFFKFTQLWHRDVKNKMTTLKILSDEKPKSLRMNIYFFDETGFQIIPKSHKLFYSDRVKEEEIWRTGLSTKTNLKIAKTIEASAGDILIFHPDLLHRAYCAHKRSHFHLAFNLNDSNNINDYPNLTKNIKYNEERPFVESQVKSSSDNILRVIYNVFSYYSPIPSINYFRFLIKKPSYLDNKFIQRSSVFNKKIP